MLLQIEVKQKMLSRSVTFGPKSVEKRPQQGNFFELTTPTTYSCLQDSSQSRNTKCVPLGYKLTYRFLPNNIFSIEAVPALHLYLIVPFTHSCARVATTFQLTWWANLNTRGVRNTKGVQCFARITSCACRFMER